MNLDTKIQENNLLVRVRMTKFGNTKRDKSISNEVTESKGAKDKLIRVNKTLFDSPVIKSLNSNQGQIRNHTIPDHGALWDGDGWYIQGVAMFDKFDAEMKRKYRKQDDLKAELRKTYPDILDRARRDLGAAFDINDYPTVDEVVDSYSIKVEKNKIPDSDIKLNLPKAALEKMKADIEASVTERVENATRRVHDRVVDALQDFVDGMERHGKKAPGAKRASKFSDNTVSKLANLAGSLPHLNITGDPKLTQAANDLLTRFSNLNPEDLRNSKRKRQSARDSAKNIIDNLTGLYD